MIWRLAHPIRGLVAGFPVFAVGSMLIGFGMGVPEFTILGLLSGIAFIITSRETPS